MCRRRTLFPWPALPTGLPVADLPCGFRATCPTVETKRPGGSWTRVEVKEILSTKPIVCRMSDAARRGADRMKMYYRNSKVIGKIAGWPGRHGITG